ncbi:MAG: hypothetical protein LBB55_06495 [Zoogloeaceae bacterium]|nr:hypothetical protein [Zoogloeaceae bacterium]
MKDIIRPFLATWAILMAISAITLDGGVLSFFFACYLLHLALILSFLFLAKKWNLSGTTKGIVIACIGAVFLVLLSIGASNGPRFFRGQWTSCAVENCGGFARAQNPCVGFVGWMSEA